MKGFRIALAAVAVARAREPCAGLSGLLRQSELGADERRPGGNPCAVNGDRIRVVGNRGILFHLSAPAHEDVRRVERRELLDVRTSGDTRCCVGACRPDRSNDRADPLADADPLRGVGRVLHLYAHTLSTECQSEGELRRREEPYGQLHRMGRRLRRARADRRLRDSGLGRTRRRVSSGKRIDGRSGGRRAVCVERPLSWSRWAVRPHRHQAGGGGKPAWARSLRSGRQGRLQLSSTSLGCR